MKRVIFVLLLLLYLWIGTAEAQIIERHNFYSVYDPLSSSFVYTDDATDTSATGDEVAVNTYLQKTIQVSAIEVGEYIEVRVEGRSLNQTNTPNWAILDTAGFGTTSADTSLNFVIDVTEYVDFLRVGIRQVGTNATSRIDIEGIFTNIGR